MDWIRKKFISYFREISPSQVMVIGFAGVILIGSLLLKLPAATASKTPLRYLDALFTATSAVCVTGLVVVDTGTYLSTFGQVIVIILIQIGGLGFMTFSTMLAILAGKRIGLRERLLIQEAFNQYKLAGLVRLIKQVVKVTFLCEGTGALLLTLRFLYDMPIKQAILYGIFHAISAFCNAGFDLFGRIYAPFSSLTAYVGDWLVSLVIAFLIIIGGLGFPVLMDIKGHRSGRRLSLHSKIVLSSTGLLIIAGFFGFMLLEYTNPETLSHLPISTKIISTFFQAVTPRTAGFNSLPIGKLRNSTLLFMIIMMFIGASPSSTGGGIKTTTFGTILATVWSMIKGKKETEVFERRLSNDVVLKAVTVSTISMSLVVLTTLLLNITDQNMPFITLFFEATSAFGTVGLSTGITPLLSDLGRVLLIFTMFSGRVGLFTIIMAVTRSLQQTESVRFVEEKVIIG
jgi:trk system potassium uptake protein TrkH